MSQKENPLTPEFAKFLIKLVERVHKARLEEKPESTTDRVA